jgi:hypothetical protein
MALRVIPKPKHRRLIRILLLAVHDAKSKGGYDVSNCCDFVNSDQSDSGFILVVEIGI